MIELLAPAAGLLLLPVAVVGWVLARACISRIHAARQFDSRSADSGRVPHLAGIVCVLGASLTLVIAMTRPSTGFDEEHVEVRAADVVFVVDVSLSMLARDESPSRIERARALVIDLIDRLPENRIGLVAFSGASGTLLPLTTDRSAVRLFVEQLNVQAVDEPGTAIDRAVARTVELFEAGDGRGGVAVIVTDGEDQSDAPVQTAAAAALAAENAGITVAVVGVGGDTGTTIPIEGGGVESIKRTRDGQPVMTIRRVDVLQELGRSGLVVLSGTGDEVEIVESMIRSTDGEMARMEEVKHPHEIFQSLLLAVSVLVLVEFTWATLRRA